MLCREDNWIEKWIICVSLKLVYTLLISRRVLNWITWVGCVCRIQLLWMCTYVCLFLCMWAAAAAAVSWAGSVIQPGAEVGFWAWLPVTLNPSRVAESRERESIWQAGLCLLAFINPCKEARDWDVGFGGTWGHMPPQLYFLFQILQ